MIKVYLDSDNYTVYNSSAAVYGTSSSHENVTMAMGATDASLSSTIEIASFLEDVSQYKVKQGFGSNLKIEDLDGNTIANFADVDGKQIVFNGVSYSLEYHRGKITINGLTDSIKVTKEPISIDIDGKPFVEDVTPTPGTDDGKTFTGTDGDDILTGDNDDNTLSGLAGNDILRGGAGVDDMDGGSGDDSFVIVGDLSAGGKVDSDESSHVLGSPLTLLNFKDLNEDEDGASETISGGDGDDTLYVFGNADISNDKITSVETVKITDNVIFNGADLAKKDITIVDGDGSSTLNIVSTDGEAITIDLADLKLDGIKQISLDKNITIQLDNLDQLGGARMLSGEGTIIIKDSSVASLGEEYTVDPNFHVQNADGDNIGTKDNKNIIGPGKEGPIEGTDENDHLEGGASDDTFVTGDGNDTLIGQAGDDNYIVDGTGHKNIIDSDGNDTLDLSQQTGPANLDLSKGGKVGDTEITFHRDSHKESIDLLILQDLSGSFGDDVSTVKGLLTNLVDGITEIQPNTYFGAASFVDKPVEGHGYGEDFVYNTDAKLTSDSTAIQDAFDSMTVLNGADGPEAQIEALYQVALRTINDSSSSETSTDEIGFRDNSMKVVVLTTDASFHQEGDYHGATMSNNGDIIVDANEDYPNIDMLKEALIESNIYPIFAVTSDVTDTYQGLVDDLGRGDVVHLSSDSSDLITTIQAGLDTVELDSIENVIGTDFNDILTGNTLNNTIEGKAGDDTLAGVAGDDTLIGGDGADTFVFSSTEDGTDTITDFEVGIDKIKIDIDGASADYLSYNSDTNELSYNDITIAVLSGVSDFNIDENVLIA